MLGAEPQISVGSTIGCYDSCSGDVVYELQEGIVAEFNGIEIFEIPLHIASLLRIGVGSNCVGCGIFYSQIVTHKNSPGSILEM